MSEYASDMDFFNWLWEKKLSADERKEYAQEFEKETGQYLEPGFAFE